MRTFAFFGAKKLRIFLNLWCVRMEGGLIQCVHFSDKGEGSIFRDFVRTYDNKKKQKQIKLHAKNTSTWVKF